MTKEEQVKVNRIKDSMLASVLFGMVAMPYSIYLGIKARKNPAHRSKILRKMLVLPILPLGVIFIAGAYAERNF
jgi:hypothetical protein